MEILSWCNLTLEKQIPLQDNGICVCCFIDDIIPMNPVDLCDDLLTIK